MSHTIRNKAKLSLRVARVRGQIEAVARALDEEAECGEVLRLIASARGAMNGLMAEVLEDHIRAHAFRGAKRGSEADQAADEVVGVLRTYLK
jgi:DNA-binding FrmR family transcriptional regulator